MPTLLRARSNYRAKPLAKLPTLVIGQNTAGYQYVLASPRGSQWNIESFGPLEQLKPVEPEPAEAETTGNATTAQDLQTSTRSWTELLQNPWQSLSPAQIKNRRVVLCLQRPDMEFCSFPLMLDPAEDPTMLIHNELEIQEHWS